MRVAFFTEAYEPYVNGVVVVINSYRRRLEQAGHEVVIFAPAYRGYHDADGHVVRLPSIVWHPVAYPCLRPFPGVGGWFRDQAFDVIHSHHPFSCGLLAERLARCHNLPLVYTFHTLLPNYAAHVPLPRPLTKRASLWIIRRHCARADHVTVTNELMRDWLVQQGVRTPVSVVGPGRVLRPPAPGARERLRSRYGIPGNAPVLLYAGRLSLEKNLELLLRAAARLAPDFDFRLVFVGGGPREGALRKLAAALGIAPRVVFTGIVPHPQMSDHYAMGDCFVFPSTSESLGLVLREAMGAGLPCVAVGVNGPRASVEDGVTGILTPPDEASFADGIRRLLADPGLRLRMGRAASERWGGGTADDTLPELLSVYNAAIECRQRQRAPGGPACIREF